MRFSVSIASAPIMGFVGTRSGRYLSDLPDDIITTESWGHTGLEYQKSCSPHDHLHNSSILRHVWRAAWTQQQLLARTGLPEVLGSLRKSFTTYVCT
jgi:hypothetical protein